MFSSATISTDALYTVFENMAQGAAFCKILFNGDQPNDFVCKSVNAAFERFTGLKNVVGKKASELPPSIREKNADLFDLCGRVVLTGAPEICETFIEPLGLWLSVFVYRPKDEHFIAIFDNVTERKWADHTLAKV